ncbi:MAG: transketolase [Bdellovibrionota bacterium]
MDKENIKLLANTVRVLSAEMIEKAKSGHPGMPLGAADLASVLWAYFLNFNPNDLNFEGRDRFVLSSGHASAMLYSFLYLFSCGLTKEDLKNFRQLGSKTPGHPEFGITDGVEVSTGPLGMGFANGVGLALSSKIKKARFSEKLFDYNVYGIVGDGDLMEGISSEAASLAGHYELGNLIYIYDSNGITIEGSTELSFTENVRQRFESYNWQVLECDGQNVEAVFNSLNAALEEKSKPTLIIAKTIIGFGSINKSNTSKVHGSPLGEDEIKLMRENFKMSDESFSVSNSVKEFCQKLLVNKIKYYDDWQKEFNEFKKTKKYDEYVFQKEKNLPKNLKQELINEISNIENAATRELSGKALQVLSKNLPNLIGGSADLASSNNTYLVDSKDITKNDFEGKNIRFGVRENAMGAIMNAFSYEKMWFPFCATFLVFSDYLRPTIRIAALSKLQTLFIFTHDSVAVGEDGPTHQPVETISSLRLIPNLYVFRPADGLEVAISYFNALNLKDSPSAFILTRQKLPIIKRENDFNVDDILKGAYVVKNSNVKEIVIVATGSEVSLALEACKLLEEKNIFCRVVSMVCMETFLEQSDAYKESIIPSEAKVISLEMGSTAIWGQFVGRKGLGIGIDVFGESAPASKLLDKYGFAPSKVAKRIETFLAL